MPIYISLGSNCSITYQLNLYNLRKVSFPFDWSKVSINQLINILESDFTNFSETLEIKKISLVHNLGHILTNTLDSYSLILKNIYNINFAHEISKPEELVLFKNKLNQRIARFKNLKYNLESNLEYITFLRIELQQLNKDYYTKIIKLLSLLNNYCNNFKIKLIVHEKSSIHVKKLESNDKIIIHFYKHFSEDWRMNDINWQEVFRE